MYMPLRLYFFIVFNHIIVWTTEIKHLFIFINLKSSFKDLYYLFIQGQKQNVQKGRPQIMVDLLLDVNVSYDMIIYAIFWRLKEYNMLLMNSRRICKHFLIHANTIPKYVLFLLEANRSRLFFFSILYFFTLYSASFAHYFPLCIPSTPYNIVHFGMFNRLSPWNEV